MKMHADELDVSVELVHALVAEQMPQWADQPLVAVTSTGTSNAMYRLGDDKVVRLPLQPGARTMQALDSEHRWLPVLAPQLSLATPVALAVGQPTVDYPMPWTVCPWLDGGDGIVVAVDLEQAAIDLANFLRELQGVDPTGGPVPLPELGGRGVPLATRDASVHRSLAASEHLVDTAALLEVWNDARNAPAWHRDPLWVHGDIAAGNLLFCGGTLSAVIDWSQMAVGDPACDLIVAWEMFDHSSRQILRNELQVDDATWLRSRGWALSTAIDAGWYYEHTNQFMFEQALHKLDVLLNEPV